MKKIIISIAVVVIMVVSSLVYLEISKKNNSYSTPEEALSHVKNPKIEILEIIDTKFFEEKSVSYIFFYSEGDKPKDYLAVGRVNKNKYGWRFVDIIGVGNVGNIYRSNAGSFSGSDEYLVGFASTGVDKVKLGIHEAEILTLDEKDMKVWLFHGFGYELLKQNDLKFLDKEGNELEAY